MYAEEGVITFCQTDLPTVAFSAFQNMRKNGELCDLRIKVQNHSITAHRVILSAAIPYFRKVFTSDSTETNEKEFALEDLDPRALECLIDFAYSSKVTISMGNVQSLLVASQILQIIVVRDACVEYLSRRIQINNVAQLSSLGLRLNNSSLTENSNYYIKKNFQEFSERRDFLSLPYSCIKEIISEDDLSVQSEETVFEAIINWVKYSPAERQPLLADLLNEVRMTLLPVNYLVEKVDCEELISSSRKCQELLNKVKAYHMLPEKRPIFSNLKILPRRSVQYDLYAVCCSDDLSCVYRFDAVQDKWHSLAPQAVIGGIVHNAVAVNGNIYIFVDQIIHKFHLKTHEWTVQAKAPEHIEGSAVVQYENAIYFFGSGDDRFKNTVRCYDTEQNLWLKEGIMGIERWDPAAAVLEEFIYVTGGHSTKGRTSSAEKYSPLNCQFTAMPPMLTPRDEHGCASMKGKVYVCGGNKDMFCALNTAEAYDPTINQWKFICSMKNLRFAFSLVSHNNKIYALQGNNAEVYCEENDIWESDFNVPEGFRCALSICGTTSK